MNIINKKNKGLTLIETLVAIAILLMSTVMPMVIYSNSITNSIYASDQITATYLAQEAVELVKYKVDTEFNADSPWFSTLPNCNGNNKCTIEIPSGVVCRSINCNSKLYLDSNNLYTHSPSSKPTKFSRTVKFGDNPSKTGALVSSTVKWKSGGKDRSVTMEEYMTKWR